MLKHLIHVVKRSYMVYDVSGGHRWSIRPIDTNIDGDGQRRIWAVSVDVGIEGHTDPQ